MQRHRLLSFLFTTCSSCDRKVATRALKCCDQCGICVACSECAKQAGFLECKSCLVSLCADCQDLNEQDQFQFIFKDRQLCVSSMCDICSERMCIKCARFCYPCCLERDRVTASSICKSCNKHLGVIRLVCKTHFWTACNRHNKEEDSCQGCA